MKWSNELINSIEDELLAIPHGNGRKAHAENIADDMGISVATLYRKVDITGGHKKAPREPDVPQHIIDLVGRVKLEPAMYGRSARFLTTEDAIAVLEDTGTIDPGLLTVSTADRRLREAGFNQQRSYSRHEEDFANQLHQFDFSRSEYFTYSHINDNGDYVLKVDGSQGAWSYKNKGRDTKDRKRLWVASYLDTYSRAWVVRYFASPGENINMGVGMLEFMWQRQDGEHPLLHLPLETMKSDKGPMSKSKAFKRGLDWLNIRYETAESKSDRYIASQAMGKVENRFKTLWTKEVRWAMVLKKRNVKEVTLSDLNALVHEYCTNRLQRKHPVRPQSIDQVYRTGILSHEQRTVAPDFDLRMLFFSEDTRVVSPLNEITVENQLYKVPEGYRDQKIYYVKFPDGRMKGMSPDRRQTFELIEFDAATATGSRTHTPTYKELLAERGPVEMDGNRISLNGNSEKKALPDNVHTLGAREQEQAPETPFTAKPREDVFDDWDDAKAYICEMFQCRWSDLTPSTQEMFNDLFEIKKLSKQRVEDLAQTAS